MANRLSVRLLNSRFFLICADAFSLHSRKYFGVLFQKPVSNYSFLDFLGKNQRNAIKKRMFKKLKTTVTVYSANTNYAGKLQLVQVELTSSGVGELSVLENVFLQG